MTRVARCAKTVGPSGRRRVYVRKDRELRKCGCPEGYFGCTVARDHRDAGQKRFEETLEAERECR